MFLDLLHFGDGPQAAHYFVLCLASILGTLQAVAVRHNRQDLIWINGRGGYVFGVLVLLASFIWFFLTDEEIFIPGLAGGELFVVFVSAFISAVPVTRLVNLVLIRLRWLQFVPENPSREREPLA